MLFVEAITLSSRYQPIPGAQLKTEISNSSICDGELFDVLEWSGEVVQDGVGPP